MYDDCKNKRQLRITGRLHTSEWNDVFVCEGKLGQDVPVHVLRSVDGDRASTVKAV